MQVFRNLADVEISPGAVVVIGNFDGVHRGHQQLITTAKKIADIHKKPVVLLSFNPHPDDFFSQEKKHNKINRLHDNLCIIKRLGVNYVIFLPFDKKLASLKGVDFISNILYKGLEASNVVTGFNFRYGRNREGDIYSLQCDLQRFSIGLEVVSPFFIDEHIVSSSLIRQYLSAGRVKEANEMLGYRFFLRGKVRKGAGNGAMIGFPTANFKLYKKYVRLKYGVYIVEIEYDCKKYSGVANFGVRPTLDGKQELLEVHIFDFNKKIYGERLCISFLEFLRHEMKFSSLNQLKLQINKDILLAKNIIKDKY